LNILLSPIVYILANNFNYVKSFLHFCTVIFNLISELTLF